MTRPQAVLVTGGGSGIGAAVARTLAAAGSRVAICGRRADALRAVAAQTGALDLVCDVRDPRQVARTVEAAAGEFGRLDGLVLNAGVMAPGGVADLSPEDWSAMVSVNLTQSLAVDHAHEGLRANVVCPGWTVTEMADEEMAAFGAERGVGVPDAYALVTALVPQRRPAHAGEVAAVVAWLLSDAASYVNGAVIPVDGSASAVDVGTMAFDPRVSLRPEGGSEPSGP